MTTPFNEFEYEEQVLVVQALQSALAVAADYPVMLPACSDEQEKPTEAQAAAATEFIRHCLRTMECPSGWELPFARVLYSVVYLWSNLLHDLRCCNETNKAMYGVEITDELLNRLTAIAKSFVDKFMMAEELR